MPDVTAESSTVEIPPREEIVRTAREDMARLERVAKTANDARQAIIDFKQAMAERQERKDWQALVESHSDILIAVGEEVKFDGTVENAVNALAELGEQALVFGEMLGGKLRPRFPEPLNSLLSSLGLEAGTVSSLEELFNSGDEDDDDES